MSLFIILKWLQIYIDRHYWSCFPPCSYEGREIRLANTNLPSEAMHREFAMVYPTADGLGADFQTRRHFRDRKKRREGRGRLFGHLYETFFCSRISRAAWRARRRTRSRSAAERAGALARYFAPGSPASLIFAEFSAISFPCIQQGWRAAQAWAIITWPRGPQTKSRR